MSNDYDIEMSLNDTLELDTIVQEWSNPSDFIKESEAADTYDLNGIQTNTGIFNPKGAGDYKFNINGHVISIKVTDPSTIPDGTIDNFEPFDSSPTGVYKSEETVEDYYSGSISRFQRDQTHVFEGSWATKHTTNGVGNYAVTSMPSDGLNYYPVAGDRFRVYWYHGHSRAVPRMSFGLQTSGDESSGYKLGVRHTDGVLRLFGSWDDPIKGSMDNPTVGEWHYLDMDWGKDGNLSGTAYNVTSDTQLGTVSYNDTTYESGGVGLEHDGVGNQSGSVWFDGFKLIE